MIEFLLGIGFCLFALRVKEGGLWVQLVGYGVRSPVGVSKAIRRKAIEEEMIAPAPSCRSFPFGAGFCKFCVECQRYVKEI
ncbi:hypothetical protein [Microcoleus sp. B9-D4]|uniref:hypothetical protein n=1 Tax=Microcoleus sp. B9-D4 TaxID=2818711 RepID=UPI002FD5E240